MMRKQPKFNKAGMKMLVQTGHKTFDRQTNYLDAGNVHANTMIGAYIRPSSETACNGRVFPIGSLRAFDLKQFGTLPMQVLSRVLEETHTQGVWLAQFHHYRSPLWKGQKIVDGYLLYRYNNHDPKKPYCTAVGLYAAGPTTKSQRVVLEAARYLVNNHLRTLQDKLRTMRV